MSKLTEPCFACGDRNGHSEHCPVGQLAAERRAHAETRRERDDATESWDAWKTLAKQKDEALEAERTRREQVETGAWLTDDLLRTAVHHYLSFHGIKAGGQEACESMRCVLRTAILTPPAPKGDDQ